MGFKAVYESLRDIFPQVDARVLKAVAIEHSKDVEAAVNAVLMEVIPFMYKKSISPAQKNSSPGVLLNKEGQYEEQKNSKDKQIAVIKNSGPSKLRFVNCEDSNNSSYAFDSDEKHLNGALDQSRSEVSNFYAVHDGNNQSYPNSNATAHGNGDIGNYDPQPIKNVSFKVLSSENFGELCNDIGTEQHILMPSLFHQNGIDGSPNDDHTSLNPIAADDSFPTTNEKTHEVESCNPLSCEGPLVSASENLMDSSLDLPLKQDCSVYGNIGIGELTCKSLNTHSAEVCRIDFLEEIIEVAKNNKKTLFIALEEVNNAMREVEMMEKAAELAQKEAANGGLDILVKVEELKQMLMCAKEGNGMHAGKMLGEKAILATEVRELQSRLLSLSDKRDKYLQILNEMRQALDIRLAMAEELRKVAEQEKMDEEQYAKRALVEQEALMVKVVEESKMLQQQADENSKLQEFLIDRGRVVDTLQGEISVICQNVKTLKEKFDEGVPFSKSLSSTQTGFTLAPTGSVQKSSASDLVCSNSSSKYTCAEKDPSLNNSVERSPPSSIDEQIFDEEKKKGKDEYKALVDDEWDWDVFDEIQDLDL